MNDPNLDLLAIDIEEKIFLDNGNRSVWFFVIHSSVLKSLRKNLVKNELKYLKICSRFPKCSSNPSQMFTLFLYYGLVVLLEKFPSELSNPEFHIIPLKFKFSFVVFNVIFGGFLEKFYVQTARFEKLGTNGKSYILNSFFLNFFFLLIQVSDIFH